MDTYCRNCGEPWDLVEVAEFRGEDLKLWSKGFCPGCEGKIELRDDSMRMDTMRAIEDLFGDDEDGLASAMEDFDLFFGDLS